MKRENLLNEILPVATYLIPAHIPGCGEHLILLRADGGNHFTEYGVYEGSRLLVDPEQPFRAGSLSVYAGKNQRGGLSLKLSDIPLEPEGFSHVGRVMRILPPSENSLNNLRMSTVRYYEERL